MWCQEIYCQAEQSPTILSFGEQIGDMEIVKPLIILRSSILYKAKRGNTNVLVKIAQEGSHERLQREAKFLLELRPGIPSVMKGARPHRLIQAYQQRRWQQRWRHYSTLPILLPAYEHQDINKHYYGKTVFRGELKYYSIFQDVLGDPLRTLLLRNNQFWFKNVGTILIGVAEAINLMHRKNVFHLCLSPDMILIYKDKQNISRPLLIDLGAVCDANEAYSERYRRYVHPIYRSPEMIKNGRIISPPTTDIYGLGLTLYELLAGQPAYPYRQRTNADIETSILKQSPLPLNRPDLTTIPEITLQALNKDQNQRQPNVLDFLKYLRYYFPPVSAGK
jgi:serine/threonine protein kinase